MSETAKTRVVGEKSESIGEYVVVKSIDIVFNEGIKPSNELAVSVAGEEKSAKRIKADLPERTHRWSFEDGLCMFPNSTLSIRPLHSRKASKHFKIFQRDQIDNYSILVKDIISSCKVPNNRSASSSSDELDYTGTPPGDCSRITLKVILGDFFSSASVEDTTSLNANAKWEILESLSSSDSLQGAVDQLQSVFDIIDANVEVVEKLKNMLETAASVHPIAQAAVSALLIPYKLLKAEREFKKDIQSLADQMRFLLTLLKDGHWIAKLSSTKDAVMEIMKGFIDASLFIKHFVRKSRIKQFGAAQIRSELDEHVKCFKKLRENFRDALNVQTAGSTEEIKGDVRKIAEDGEERRAKEFLKEKLEPVTQQSLGDLCLQGTRATILDDVENWIKDTSRPNVLWISGAPGAGKSTISATIVKKILKYKCARFFVKRGATPELRDPRRIWRSITFNLAEKYRGVKDDITNALREKAAEYPKDAEVGDQFHDLLEAPIRKHAESFPTDCPCVVIIDALDECSRTSDGDWRALLGTLAGWNNLPPNVRLIVTSRNEKDIRDHLLAVSEPIVLETGNETSEETTNDIRLFFESRFAKMGVPDKAWPGEDMIRRLTRHAAGLFIWAKTVVEFVGHKNWHPPRRLKIICDNMDRGSTDVDGLYGQVLYETLSDMEDNEQDVAKFVLAAVSFGIEPFSIQEVVDLLAPEGGDQWDEANSAVALAVEAFSPIINVREELLSVCHKTLSDFLTDEARMREVITQVFEHAQRPANEKNLLRYTMRCSEQNGRLAEACLRLMNKKLKFNICHVPTSHCFHRAIPNHDALVKEHIPHILFYACQYWAEHLNAVDESASQTQDAVLPALKDFLWTHILHWLEVISLTGSMGCVPFSLSCAERFTKVWDDDALSELARDAKQFVATFYDAISVSAPHIYLSALPFTPAESKVAQVYGPRHPNTLSVLTGRLPSRSEMLPVAEMRGHSIYITCVAYLPDGKRIASGSGDRNIRIWDAHSGRAIAGAVLEHSDVVRALSPSPDGDKLASFCDDGTFGVWDINENRCTFNMKVVPDSSNAFKLELSPDWENCAVTFLHRPFEVWGTKDGQLKGTGMSKNGAEGCGNIVKFSPDGSSLIYASGGSIIMRNTKNWETDGMPIVTELYMSCLAVSADGKMFASGDFTGTIQLYDCQERRPLGNPMQHRCDFSAPVIEFSVNGSLLVSASSNLGDRTLCVWDTKTQERIGGPHRIDLTIDALSFSPDGSRFAVAAYDTVQVFDVESCIGVRDDDRPSDVMDIYCIAFDKHRRRFATGSSRGVVRVWDVHSLSMLAEWVDDSLRGITSLEFVQDSDVIAFSSESGHVRKWNWKTQQLCHDLVINDLRGIRYCTISILSPDGRHIAFSVKGEACRISLWDYNTNCEVRRFVTHDDQPRFKFAFSPGGELFAIETADGGVEIWRVAFAAGNNEHPTCSIELENRGKLECIVFSPDAKQLAFYAYTEKEALLHVWDFETHPEPKLLGKSIPKWDTPLVSFSLLGNIILTSSTRGSGTAQFWNVSTNESIGKVSAYGDLGCLKAAELLNDGTLICVENRDTIKLWDVGLDDGLQPRLLQSVNALDSSNTAKVSFVEDSLSVTPWQAVRKNHFKSMSSNSASTSYPAFIDGMGAPVIRDWSYMDEEFRTRGWMRSGCANSEKSNDDPILFWVPPPNRDNFWWPRTTAIMNPRMDQPVTRIDFSRFVHGEDWHLCGEPDLPKKLNAYSQA